jgi:predicted nucleotidyltransferase
MWVRFSAAASGKRPKQWRKRIKKDKINRGTWLMVDMEKIQEFADSIAREFKPERIILFGSYAYGNPSEGSDVDMLVIMPFRGDACYKSIEILKKIDHRFGVDLIVRTPAKIRQRLKWNDFFIKEIIEKGKVLYEADNT